MVWLWPTEHRYPCFRYYNLSRPFLLDTDASDVGMGAVLSQVGPEGDETRRELLATSNITATSHFKYYPFSRPLRYVRTGYSALLWLMSFNEPKGQKN